MPDLRPDPYLDIDEALARVNELTDSEPDPNQQAAKAVEKITGSQPVRGEDLASSEDLKQKFPEAKKKLKRNKAGAKAPLG